MLHLLSSNIRRLSHPSRGAWIEMRPILVSGDKAARRTPHGVRGLKYSLYLARACDLRRTPHGVRGLKFSDAERGRLLSGRTPHGVRGLKYADVVHVPPVAPRRTPHGVRGLKW